MPGGSSRSTRRTTTRRAAIDRSMATLRRAGSLSQAMGRSLRRVTSVGFITATIGLCRTQMRFSGRTGRVIASTGAGYAARATGRPPSRPTGEHGTGARSSGVRSCGSRRLALSRRPCSTLRVGVPDAAPPARRFSPRSLISLSSHEPEAADHGLRNTRKMICEKHKGERVLL